MARNDNVEIPPAVWTQLTNADASSIRVQSVSATEMMLQATHHRRCWAQLYWVAGMSLLLI